MSAPPISGDVAPWLYAPWLPEHGDALIQNIAETGQVRFAPVHLFPPDKPEARRHVALLAGMKPQAYRRAVRRRLLGAAPFASGLVVTFDWAPAIRQLVAVARELGLPTVLVPHEGVFFDEERYYGGKGTAPVADRVLGWGQLHHDVFTRRGYPPDAIEQVGSPKLSSARRYRAQLDPAEWRDHCGLQAGQRFALFAMQPLDNVADPAVARAGQKMAIADCAAACRMAGLTLLVRPPPSDLPDLLPDELPDACLVLKARHGIAGRGHEVIAHCAAVFSLGSTMLIEAALMGVRSIMLSYGGVRSGSSIFRMPVVNGQDEILAALQGPAFIFNDELERLFGAVSDGDPALTIADRLLALRQNIPLKDPEASRLAVGDSIDLFIRFQSLGLPPKLRKLILSPAAFLRDSSLISRFR
jgi:hypothetical protein